jgi:dimethylamine corrinoid protein
LAFDKIKQAVVLMERERVKDLVKKSLEKGESPKAVLEQGLIAGMKEVSKLFSTQEYFVPEVLMASEAFYAGFDLVSPLIKKDEVKEKGKIVIGVVEGDIHDIGKNIVKVMLEASGYQVIDLGKDVPIEKFVETVREVKPAILALSALMTTTMVKMGEVIETLRQKQLRDRIKIIIGGAPVNKHFAQKIGADACGEDATAAIKLCEELIG